MARRRFGRYIRKQARRAGRYARRRYTAAGGGVNFAQVASDVYKLKGIINSELKTSDVDLTTASIGTSGATFNLTQIAQGDDYQNREGRSVLLKSIQIRGDIRMSGSATNTYLRIVIIQDTNNQAANFSGSDVFPSGTWVSQLRSSAPDKMKRFNIMLDKTYVLNNAKSTSTLFEYYRKMNVHLKFDNTDINAVTNNRYQIFFISSEATNTPSFAGTARVRYYDN